jgi:SNF2 family DNA or RNA helicase
MKSTENLPGDKSTQTPAVGSNFKVGDFVSLKSNPGVIFPVIEVLPGGAECRYRVFENNAKTIYYASQLQAAPETPDERRLVTVRELHARLTSLQILSPSTANLFSLRSGRVQFVPYQYRPVLKLIRSDRPRLLIADEVGVGKTIETGFIIKELQARMEIASVLVICPKALIAEKKWYSEMKRFDEDFTALDGPLLRQCLHETDLEGEWPAKYAKALLPFSLFDSDLLFGRKGVQGLLTLDPPPKFDLVIVDEAHHIRNTSTLLHDGVRFFCDNAQAVVFLTATPVQLGSEDLFTLLNVLRPDLVIDQASFRQMAEPNQYISDAVRHCRLGDSGWQSEALDCMSKVAQTDWGKLFLHDSPAFLDICGRLQCETLEPADRVMLIRAIEEIYTFSPIINRTRRRDIGEFTTRRPQTLTIEFTAEQKQLHDGLLDLIERILSRCHGLQNVKFMMTTIRRQAASCLYGLAPMLDDLLRGKLDTLELQEAGDSDDEADLSFVKQVRADIEILLNQAKQLAPADPKVEAFVKVLSDKRECTNSKALVFSTFRHTLRYLDEHARRSGLRVGLIHGQVGDDERRSLRRRFSLPAEDSDAIDVLLSSEVGCEGLDFQFCDMLINYDLPWNPMRIEQRIGRIDRYGQQSKVVVIVNLITPGTVDADIYGRCLSRIGVFNHAVGGCEEILGEITRELHKIADNFELSASERDARLQQLADNSINKIREEQELESKQSELFGLNVPNQTWLEEIQDAESFWLSPTAIQGGLRTYLTFLIAGETEHILGDKPLKTLRLSQEARARLLDDFKKMARSNDPVSRDWEKWLKGQSATLSVTFDQAFAAENPKTVHLSVLHPLIRQAARFLEIPEPAYVSLTTHSKTLPAGSHFFALYKWEKHGIRSDEMLVTVADDPQVEEALFTMLQTASDSGDTLLPSPDEFEALDMRHHKKWSDAKASHVAANRQLVEHRIQSLGVSHRARKAAIADQIARATNDKIRVMKQGELARANADFERRMLELRQAANSGDIQATPIVFGTIFIIPGVTT